MTSSSSKEEKPKMHSLKDWVSLIFCGLCMGTADIIPGISGGTIAFIMGYYEDLLNSIKSLNRSAFICLCRGQLNAFFSQISWKFLLGLVIGIVTAMVTLAHLVTYILNQETYRPLLYAVFFGLILAAAYLTSLQLKRWTLGLMVAFAAGVISGYLLTDFSFLDLHSSGLLDVQIEVQKFDKQIKNYDTSNRMLLAIPSSTVSAMLSKGIISSTTFVYDHDHDSYSSVDQVLSSPSVSSFFDGWIILCGTLAMSALILPGISGSYLLTILGMYAPVIGALADFTGGLIHVHFDKDAFLILANMLIGIILGAMISARFVSWLLNKYHDIAIAILTGCMVGALKVVWPFWSYQYVLLPLNLAKGPQLEAIHPVWPSLTSPATGLAFLMVLFGAALVFTIHYLAHNKRTLRTIRTPRT